MNKKGQTRELLCIIALVIAGFGIVLLAKPIMTLFAELAKASPFPGITLLLGVVFLLAMGVAIYSKVRGVNANGN